MKALVLALCAVSLAGCATQKAGYQSLAPGATKAQVIEAMGSCPNATLDQGKYVALTYNNRMLSFFQWNAATYTFILKDGQLVEFGVGTAAQAGTAAEPKLVVKPPLKG